MTLVTVLLGSPALSTQTIKTFDAPTSSGGGGGRVFLKPERVVLERRRLYCDSEREIDMGWTQKGQWTVVANQASR